MKKLFDFFSFGNFIVSLGAFFLVFSTSIQLRLSTPLHYGFLIFFSTLFIYNIQRVFYKKEKKNYLNSSRRKWIFNNQASIKGLSIFGLLGVFTTAFFVELKFFIYLIPLCLISLAYFLPAINLRKIALVKLLTLVLVWTATTSVLPILLNNQEFTLVHFIHIFSRFAFMMAICLPFDLRDLQIDASQNIKTIPHIIGERKTKLLAISFILIYGCINSIEFYLNTINSNEWYCLMLVFIVSFLLLTNSNSKRNEYYYVVAIDSLMILEGILLLYFG